MSKKAAPPPDAKSLTTNELMRLAKYGGPGGVKKASRLVDAGILPRHQIEEYGKAATSVAKKVAERAKNKTHSYQASPAVMAYRRNADIRRRAADLAAKDAEVARRAFDHPGQKHWSEKSKTDILRAAKFGSGRDLAQAQSEATIDAAVKKLTDRGWSVEHSSASSGSASRYLVSPRQHDGKVARVRVSDHYLPERTIDESVNGRYRRGGQVIVENTTTARRVVGEILGVARRELGKNAVMYTPKSVKAAIGPAGWSDAARAASIEARQADMAKSKVPAKKPRSRKAAETSAAPQSTAEHRYVQRQRASGVERPEADLIKEYHAKMAAKAGKGAVKPAGDPLSKLSKAQLQAVAKEFVGAASSRASKAQLMKEINLRVYASGQAGFRLAQQIGRLDTPMADIQAARAAGNSQAQQRLSGIIEKVRAETPAPKPRGRAKAAAPVPTGTAPAGWSDAAREASAKARGVAAPGEAKAAKPKPPKVAELRADAVKAGIDGAAKMKKPELMSLRKAGKFGWIGPAAIVGAAAVAYDATKNQAMAAGKTSGQATANAAGAAAVAGGAVAATGWGIGKAIAGAAKLAPVAGKVLARAVPVAAIGLAAYEVGKGAIQGYQSGGAMGALKGAGTGAADFATMGAYSHFANKPAGAPVSATAKLSSQRSVIAGAQVGSNARQPAAEPKKPTGIVQAHMRVMRAQGGGSQRVKVGQYRRDVR